MVGDGRTLLAVAAKAPSTAQSAFFVPAVGILGLNGDNLSPSSVTTNTVAANSITSAKINVASLSAISADCGTITAGTISANVIVAANSFTASAATFNGDVSIRGAGTTDYTARFQAQGLFGAGTLELIDFTFRTGGYIQGTADTLWVTGDEKLQLGDSSTQLIGFFGTSAVARPTISAADSTSIIQALVDLGLVTT